MYVFLLPVFIAKAIGSFANLPCKREDCCLAVNSLECQTSILFIKSVIGQVISLQLAVLLISSHSLFTVMVLTVMPGAPGWLLGKTR